MSRDTLPRAPGALEAVELRPGRYVVRPAGALGTCGFYPYPWQAIAVNARTPAAAVAKVNGADVGAAWRLA